MFEPWLQAPSDWDEALLRMQARGRRTRDIYLPGDREWYEERERDLKIKRALVRDSHLNPEEQVVRDCTWVRLRFDRTCAWSACSACPWPRRDLLTRPY